MAREREQDLKKKLEEELEFHRLANTQLSDQDKVLKKTEEDRDKFLNDLEDEQKLRRELQAALLMAQEAIKTESTAAAKNAAEEKEKELQLAINDLNQQRKELKIRLTIEIEKLEKEKRSSNENLAKTQKDQQNLLLKFRQEHDKVEKMEAEKKELQDELNDNKSICKDLEDQIADLKIKLNNKTSASEKDHKRNQKAMEDMEKALETANVNLRTTEGKFSNLLEAEKNAHKKDMEAFEKYRAEMKDRLARENALHAKDMEERRNFLMHWKLKSMNAVILKLNFGLQEKCKSNRMLNFEMLLKKRKKNCKRK